MVNELTNDKKYNLKIYSLYRAVSLDFLFYYVIEFLFLTQVKGLSESAVAMSYTYYAIFKIAFQMPANYVIKYLGNKKSIILGNCLNALFMLLVMKCDNVPMLIITNFITALGFSFKEVADLSLLKASIPDSKTPGKIYAKSESKGYKNYYLLNAITSIFAGSLFVINPYLPIIGSEFFLFLSIFIALAFKDIKTDKKEEKKLSTKHYLKELKKQGKFITNSPRLRCLFIYIGVMSGIISILITYRTSLLVDIGLKNQYITIVIALVGMTCSIGSKIQEKFENRFKNKSLSMIIMHNALAIILLGICGKDVTSFYRKNNYNMFNFYFNRNTSRRL